MTDRPTPSDDSSTSPSSDYQAPRLYESSDLLAKYRTPAPDVPGHDLTSDAVGEVVASAGAAAAPAAPAAQRTPTADGASRLSRPDASGSPVSVGARQSLLTDVATVANTIGHRGTGIGALPTDRVEDTAGWYADATRTRRATATAPTAGATKPVRGMPPTYPAPGGTQPARAATTARAAAKPSNVGIYLGIGAVVAALIGWPWAVWPLALMLIVVGIYQLRPTGPNKVRGSITIVLALASIVLLVINPLAEAFGGAATAFGGPNGSIAYDGTGVVSGSGDAKLDVVLPDGPSTPALIEVTHDGDSFRVYEIDMGGEESYSSSYSAYREGSGTAVINGDPLARASGLSIEAEGNWTLTIASVTTLPAFDTTYSGEGDDLFLYTGGAGEAVFAMQTDDSFTVTTHGEDDWDLHVRGVTSVTRPWAAGPIVVEVESYEAWSVTVTPTGAATTAPAPGDELTTGEEPALDQGATDEPAL